MSLQQHLIAMLGESLEVEHTDADVLSLTASKGAGRAPVPLFAPESHLADYAATHAADGLAALGEVGDDSTGALAALALLSVHVDEALSSPQAETVARLSVSGAGLAVERIP